MLPQGLAWRLFPGHEARIRMRARTFTRLCGKEKFGMVEVRTVSLSQLRGFPGTGIATKPWRHERQGSAGKAVPQGR
jgi:hypothetical protein